MLTLSATAPAAAGSGWTTTPPATYTFSSAGVETLYAWAKDAAGNVSTGASASTTITIVPPPNAPKSITSTSQNRLQQSGAQVAEQPATRLAGYQIVAANDLGMHCGDLDQRIASILPPFNVLHAQVIQKGHTPVILDQSAVEMDATASSTRPATSVTPGR